MVIAMPVPTLPVPLRGALAQLWRFGLAQGLSCFFAVAVFAMLAVTKVVDLPIPRYDLLLAGFVLLTLALWLAGIETTREVAVIALFHLVGLALELFKVRTGSWAYPEQAYTKVAGVPLYSGFMYAAVGSYMCQSWRRLDLRLIGYRPLLTSIAALAAYVNFFTHHWIPDLRVFAGLALLAAVWPARVSYRVGGRRYQMPLALSFALIGANLWLAENIATFFGAWKYPNQTDVWRMVHVSKYGSWALLVSVSFVLVATIKSQLPRPTEPAAAEQHPAAEPATAEPAAAEPRTATGRSVFLSVRRTLDQCWKLAEPDSGATGTNCSPMAGPSRPGTHGPGAAVDGSPWTAADTTCAPTPGRPSTR